MFFSLEIEGLGGRSGARAVSGPSTSVRALWLSGLLIDRTEREGRCGTAIAGAGNTLITTFSYFRHPGAKTERNAPKLAAGPLAAINDAETGKASLVRLISVLRFIR